MRKDVLREYWLHKPTGRMWAVEVVDGTVRAAGGPLAVEDAAPELLDHLPYDRGEAPWINRAREEFVRAGGRW